MSNPDALTVVEIVDHFLDDIRSFDLIEAMPEPMNQSSISMAESKVKDGPAGDGENAPSRSCHPPE